MILNQHKSTFIIIATAIYLYRTFDYYNSDDVKHQNHTMHEEVSEILNFNNEFSIV